ncbi:nuclear transport factor 2 family protein [Planococcus sp. CAU13]|uniref:nuclear transport factor 2 family protein n=1 Tax=Planococcus sp. CAU13 TaxID=1541197 RepID=UPI00052FDB95|nr:nuclear transport factor 2 family protein [Planococcus sp. CAU13]
MEEREKKEFFRKFTSAFFKGDQDFISEHVTDDVLWSIVGTEPVKGKQGLLDAAFGVADFSNMEYEIESVICNEGEAAVKGVSRRKDVEGNPRNFCFCDVYTLDRGNPQKVKSIITFMIELQQEKQKQANN